MKRFLRLTALVLPAAALLQAQQPPDVSSGARARARQEVRAEAYFQFAMGRYYAEMYEATSRSEYATQAIENLKKAYELDPGSGVIGEQLAEIYFRAQRIRDAVLEAGEILKRDPDNLGARRLLARIYVRTLGDLNPSVAQRETATRAIEQFREILRVEPGDAEAAQWLARLYRLQNAHGKAEEVLRGFLARDPESESGLAQFTQLLLDQGRAAEAVALLEPRAERSASADLLDLLGEAYAQLHQYNKAEATFRRAVELEPGEAGHRRGLAQALLAQWKTREALEQYRQLVQLDPENPDLYLRLAQIYRQLNQLDQAEESLLRAKQRAPGSLEVIYNEALLYEAQGRFEDAIRVLSGALARAKAQAERGTENRRTLAVLYEQLGRTYRESQNFATAVATFQEMAHLGPEEEKRARELIIDAYRAGKDIGRALAESEKARKLYTSDPAVEATHAMLLGEKGETDAAAAILRGLLRGGPGDRGTWLGLAQVYERGRRYAEAEQAAREAENLAALPAENEMAYFLLAAIFERQDRLEPAEENFKKALALNPRNAAVLNYYGYMLAERGVRLEEAVALVERALAEEPHNGAYLDSLGWAYFKLNRLAQAEEYLRKALTRNSDDPTIHEHLGDLYFQTGRFSEAAREWERALAEWRRALPTEYEADKVAELEKKLARLKHRLAQAPSS